MSRLPLRSAKSFLWPCLVLACLLMPSGADAREHGENAASKTEIVKTGYNFGPLPAIAYDADKGLQLGVILQIYDYGDGHNYPNYDSKWYVEGSWFTKGSMLFQLRYDNKELIPGIRWSSALRINIDNACEFYGFNGYETFYDADRITRGNDKKSNDFRFTPFYRMHRQDYIFKSDFIGKITKNLNWEAGVCFSYHKTAPISIGNINKGKKDHEIYPEEATTLYETFHKSGVISPLEYNGGWSSALRAGMVYDSRDKEGAPSRGIWAEGHITIAPKYLSKIPYYRYSLTFRHYVPIVKNDILTFAYRLNYEGNIGNSAPFYELPYITSMGENCDLEGMGGYNTVRGMMRCRVVGLDMATYTAEFRWRFVQFSLWKQNIALALNAFSDGSMVTRGRDLSALAKYPSPIVGDKSVTVFSGVKEIPHVTFGGGFRFIMNNNFIVAAEYGMPTSHLYRKTSPYYNQDGTGAFYVNIGYLF